MKSAIGLRWRRVNWRALQFWNNPMLSKELRSRMRGWRSPLTISAYLLVLGGVGCAYFLLQSYQARYGGLGPQVGLQLFVVLSLFQMLLVAFITPAFTVGSISGERERQTFDLLMCTRLTPWAIVFGKLFSGTAYSLLLLVAGLPALSIVFLFGGISLANLSLTFLVLIMNTITFAVIGLFCSALFRRTQVSTIVAYGSVFFLMIGIGIVASFIQSWQQSRGYMVGPTLPSLLHYFNPLTALGSAIAGKYAANMGLGIPYLPISIPQLYRPTLAYLKTTGLKVGWLQSWLLQTPPWLVHFLFELILIAVLLVITVQLVKPVRPSFWAWVRSLFRRRPSLRKKKEVAA
ncbi:MAG: ABC transporter permease [Chloroflexota bacterium]